MSLFCLLRERGGRERERKREGREREREILLSKITTGNRAGDCITAYTGFCLILVV